MSSRISHTEKIDFLVNRKLPNPEFSGLLSRSKNPASPEAEYITDEAEHLRRCTEYRQQLNNMPQKEFDEFYYRAQAHYDNQVRQSVEREDDKRFFHQREAEADFVHWAKLPYWSIDEGIALIFGKNPEVVNWTKIKQLRIESLFKPARSPFVEQYRKLHMLASRAEAIGQLGKTNVPGVFLKWAERMDFEPPQELLAELEKRGPLCDWQSLYEDSRELNELLQIRINQLEDQFEVRTNNNPPPLSADSEYWRMLQSKANAAIEAFPEWARGTRHIKLSGNLLEWIKDQVDANNREAEIIKNVLSEVFEKTIISKS